MAQVIDPEEIIEETENDWRKNSDNTSTSFLPIHQHIVDGDTETVEAMLSQLTCKELLLNAEVMYTGKFSAFKVRLLRLLRYSLETDLKLCCIIKY